MKTLQTLVALVIFVVVVNGTSTARAQYQIPSRSPQALLVDSATNVLTESLALPDQGIPRTMLDKAQGLVVVPGVLKIGFLAGVRRGKGIVVVRDEQGAWRAPAFVTLTGGSVGWQVGVTSTDVVLVFNTRNSVSSLLRGKFTIGVDAAAAAGPVGRQASAGTDGRLQAEVYSYSRSRGLFVGASIDGSVIEMETAQTQAYYQAAGFLPDGRPATPNAQLPPSAARFLTTLTSYIAAPVPPPGMNVPSLPAADGPATASGVGQATLVPGQPARGEVDPPYSGGAAGEVLPPTADSPSNNSVGTATANPSWDASQRPAASGSESGSSPSGVFPTNPASANSRSVTDLQNRGNAQGREEPNSPEVTRRELARSAQQLGSLLNDSWRQYLSLPKGVLSGEGVPSLESLQQSLARFDAVAKDSKYEVLLRRPEYQETCRLLRTYTEQVRQLNGLPPANSPPMQR